MAKSMHQKLILFFSCAESITTAEKYKIIQGLVVEKEEGLGAGHGSIVSSSGGGKFKHNIENVYQEKKKKKRFFQFFSFVLWN